MSIVAAIVDTREPSWVQALKFGGAMVATAQLDAGDLLITCDDGALLAIERKTPSDLLNSIREDRLWAQLAGIRKLTPWAYLMITGELRRGDDGNTWADGRQTNWQWAAVQGALIQAQEMGVFVIYAASDDDYEAAAQRLSARSRRPELLVPPAREPRILSDAEKILCALPGIGLEKVGPILDHTGSLAWALMFLSELGSKEKIPGIGPGTKRAIRRVFGLEETQDLAVITSETYLKGEK